MINYTIYPEINLWFMQETTFPDEFPLGRKPFSAWDLILVKAGKGICKIADNENSLGAGSYILFPPDARDVEFVVSKKLEVVRIAFEDSTQNIMPNINCDKRPNREIVLPESGTIPTSPDCLDLFSELFDARQNCSISHEQTGPTVESILGILSRHAALEYSTKQSSAAHIARQYLRKYWSENIRFSGLSVICGCTPEHLSREFRRNFGKTMRQMQMELRIAHSLSLLLDGCSITECAERCGFANYYHFIRVFHEIQGVPPGKFIRTLR